ncbi:MAG: hypothetical protein RMI30_06215 [Thermodesulfovibrio sp.]|nr:hypothetical protein [Thermodesulfovibrio sp.]MDW7999028.1 hypothetical protein [Thermodesulfovibrio sp.]
MADEEKIDPLLPYRGMRPIKEGSVFAKYKVKKKSKKAEEKQQKENISSEEKSSNHRIDIEV